MTLGYERQFKRLSDGKPIDVTVTQWFHLFVRDTGCFKPSPRFWQHESSAEDPWIQINGSTTGWSLIEGIGEDQINSAIIIEMKLEVPVLPKAGVFDCGFCFAG